MAEMAVNNERVVPRLVVGLGNPEPKYDQTRHNIGFAAIDVLARSWQISLAEQRKFNAIVGDGQGIPGHKVLLVKPLTYMNRSGQAIRAILDWYKLSPESVLVIYDDMDLPLGRVRLRLSGSAGGHNGMKSAIAHLGTQNFPRLRLGIGKPGDAIPNANTETIPHVLGKFSMAEAPVVEKVLKRMTEMIELGLREGVEKAMSLYNSQSIV
ncbi:MAG: aminoacyl-tRNA hydrolase [Oscillatoriales cyanobacterium RM2_1_1]|nr:aminoacyl-tRNA hydrolase [Oscillatoriales cyanobacterium SM2_3_0]NJO45520.1 aminoacyl-tRNA hydrolase [Oscillatoriales cyanobacterium RM2_1_1]